MLGRADLPHPLPDPLVELIAQRFRVLGEPMRIKLLDRLRDGGDATVTELQEAIGASQQNVSKHLGILLAAGMVARTKRGNHAVYSIADDCRHPVRTNDGSAPTARGLVSIEIYPRIRPARP